MQETIIRCDACRENIPLEDLLEFQLDYDLCEWCVTNLLRNTLKTITLCRDCTECQGKGKIRIIDEEGRYDEASRTQYKTIECDNCFHGN